MAASRLVIGVGNWPACDRSHWKREFELVVLTLEDIKRHHCSLWCCSLKIKALNSFAGLSLRFDWPAVFIFTPIATLFHFGWIISTTGNFTCNTKGPSNMLSCSCCYRLQSLLTALLCAMNAMNDAACILLLQKLSLPLLLQRDFWFELPANPFWISSFGLMSHRLRILAFQTPLPLAICNNLPWGGYENILTCVCEKIVKAWLKHNYTNVNILINLPLGYFISV